MFNNRIGDSVANDKGFVFIAGRVKPFGIKLVTVLVGRFNLNWRLVGALNGEVFNCCVIGVVLASDVGWDPHLRPSECAVKLVGELLNHVYRAVRIN